MAGNNPETALNLLRAWRILLCKESEALKQGNIHELEKLFEETSRIQKQLGRLLASPTCAKDKKIPILIKELLQEQDNIITDLKNQTEEISQEIGLLKKNKTSLKGYKQKKTSSPTFLNKRT